MAVNRLVWRRLECVKEVMMTAKKTYKKHPKHLPRKACVVDTHINPILLYNTYVDVSWMLRMFCSMSSRNSFHTVMPSLRFSSCECFTLAFSTWRSV